jgi:ABC-2 type transport system permease protein
LTLFPGPIQTIATILPFRWMVSFPVELLLSRLTPNEALIGIGIQVIWVIIGFILVHVMWRMGVKIYSAVGA